MVAGVVVALALAETGLRVQTKVSGRDPRADLRAAFRTYAPPFRGECMEIEDAPLGALLLPSEYRDLIYELKPNLDTCFHQVRVLTNSQGLRSPVTYAQPKPPGLYRILLLGDSQTFGWGVSYSETFGALMAAELSSRGRAVEVVNAGIPGYNTTQEAAFLKYYGSGYQPDCVLVLFIGNDFGLPTFLLDPSKAPVPASYVLELLKKTARSWSGPPKPVSTDPWEAVDESLFDWVSEEEMARVPEAYRHMVGVSGYRRALGSLAETAKSWGVPIVNFADYRMLDPPLVDELVRLHESLGIVRPEFQYPVRMRYWLNRRDPHLNPAGHKILAERMLKGLEEEGVCRPQ